MEGAYINCIKCSEELSHRQIDNDLKFCSSCLDELYQFYKTMHSYKTYEEFLSAMEKDFITHPEDKIYNV